ncbi:hypothetical protein LTR10_021421 [Elasticomyces elasticus]|nr:hypothetical protein LTR10_021421 [Elasticomyces elasticus]KAK4971810.1 hypothetical protein LTR42_007538 [Elasticomyces elasticus]
MPHHEISFHYFPQLPPELRDEIWRYCLPQRIRELDIPLAENVYDLKLGQEQILPCQLQNTTSINGRSPLIQRVCRESRAVANETGSHPTRSDEGSIAGTEIWNSSTVRDDVWRDPTRESVHLNWSRVYEVDFWSDGPGSPIEFLAWHVTRLGGVGSFMAECISSSYGPQWSPGDWSFCHDRNRKKDFAALQTHPRWLVVMQVIVVHLDARAAATMGLFGLLGDSCVQIVDVAEKARVKEYFDRAEHCVAERRDRSSQVMARTSGVTPRSTSRTD